MKTTTRRDLIELHVERARAVIRRQGKALSTERDYCGWLRRYLAFTFTTEAALTSEQKAEAFLTMLVTKHDVAVATQLSAFSCLRHRRRGTRALRGTGRRCIGMSTRLIEIARTAGLDAELARWLERDAQLPALTAADMGTPEMIELAAGRRRAQARDLVQRLWTILESRERHAIDLDVIGAVGRLRDRANQASVNS